MRPASRRESVVLHQWLPAGENRFTDGVGANPIASQRNLDAVLSVHGVDPFTIGINTKTIV